MPRLTDIAGGFTFPGSISVSGSAEVIHKGVIIFFGWNSTPAAAQTSVRGQILCRMKQNNVTTDRLLTGGMRKLTWKVIVFDLRLIA